MHWTLTLVFPCLALVAQSGCSEIEVRTGYARDANFEKFRSYAWIERKDVGDDRLDDPEIRRVVHDAADKALLAKGYERVSSGSPDFTIGYDVAIHKGLKVSTINARSGYSPAGAWDYRYGREAARNEPSGTTVREYELGTLVLSIAEAKSNRLIWRGWAQAESHKRSNAERREKRLRTAVEKMLSEFAGCSGGDATPPPAPSE